MLLALSLLCSELAYSYQNSSNDIDPLFAFHQEAEKSTIVDEFHLSNQSKSVDLHLYIIDQKEPYNTPLTLKIFFQCKEGPILKLSRPLENQSEKSFCDFAKPRIENNTNLLKQNGPFLLFPFATFDDDHGHCDEIGSSLEAFPIAELEKFCQSRK